MASCVPTFASCHFGKNLATKTNHKTTNIMAPITQQASCGFASPPPPSLFLQRNGVTTRSFIAKRSAKIVAEGLGDERSTKCSFFNNSSETLITKTKHVYEGDQIPNLTISPRSSVSFPHTTQINSGEASIGAIVFKQEQPSPEIEWIVAWSNKEDHENQVYVEVKKYNSKPEDWEDIKQSMDKSRIKSESSYNNYTGVGQIKANTSVPTMNATFTGE